MSADGWPPSPPPPDPGVLAEVLDAARRSPVGDTMDDAAPGDLAMDLDPVSRVPVLQGHLPTWDAVVRAGHAAARRWAELRGLNTGDLVVTVAAADAGPPESADGAPFSAGALPTAGDVVVVGAGISGLMAGYRLARAGLRVCVLDAGTRIAEGTTAWNNGMVHPGHDPRPGTAKAVLNVQGNQLWAALAADLAIPFERRPSLVVGFGADDDDRLRDYLDRAHRNGVPGARLIGPDEARRLEPRLSGRISGALYTPTTASIDPVHTSQVLATAIRRLGGTVTLTCRVDEITVEDATVTGVQVGGGHIEAPLVVNAAGVHADLLAATAGSRRYSIHARRGTLILFDPGPDRRYPISVGPIPGRYSKGGGMTARPDGLTTGGPTAVEQQSRTAMPPTQPEIDYILDLGARIYPDFPLASVVSVGSAVRPVTYGEDFVVGPAPGVPGLIDIAGIQSPGIAAAPAIADRVLSALARLGRLPDPS